MRARKLIFSVSTSALLVLSALAAPAAHASPSGHSIGAQLGRPMIRASALGSTTVPTISENWSGYAATSAKKFSYVHSTFVQPAITCDGKANRWTSNWVGLDGYSSDTVEQDGTFAHCGGPDKLTPKYQAWYELYPAGSVGVFNVQPGDVIDASVSYADGTFTLVIADLTTGKRATDAAACADCQRSSAEWIIERPALCSDSGTCFLTALANYGQTTMGGAEASVDGGPVRGIASFSDTPIYMVDPLASGGFISLDSVSAIARQSFTATWIRSGHVQPLTL